MNNKTVYTIVKIKQIRNKLSHDQNFDYDAQLLINKICNLMIIIGVSKKDLDYIKNADFKQLISTETMEKRELKQYGAFI
jgi:hypothetical protein